MKKLLLLSAWTLGIAVVASAQAPGYMGMRFFLKPEFSSTVALLNPTANNQGGQDSGTGKRSFGLNTRYGIQAGYVLSRSRVAVLEVSYVKTGMSLSVSTPSLTSPDNRDYHSLFYNLSGPELGLGIQAYPNGVGSLAPLGAFWAARTRVSFLSGEVFEHQISYYEGDGSAGHGPLGIAPHYIHFALGLEIGSHHIVADHILLGIGAELNLATGLLTSSSAIDNQGEFSKAASRRMAFHSFLLFKISAGYLF